MLHQMKLWHLPFEKIKSGEKTIEMRLFDEKRARLSVGDTIVFTDTEDGEKLTCLVTALYRYPTFDELYKNHDKAAIGYDEGERARPSDMLKYYTEEEIGRYGALGIEVKVL